MVEHQHLRNLHKCYIELLCTILANFLSVQHFIYMLYTYLYIFVYIQIHISMYMYKPEKLCFKKCRSLGPSFEIFIQEFEGWVLGICILKVLLVITMLNLVWESFWARQSDKNFVTEEVKKKIPNIHLPSFKNKNQLQWKFHVCPSIF